MNYLDLYIQNYFGTTRTMPLTEFFFLLSKVFDLSIYFVSLVVCISFMVYLIKGLRQVKLFVLSLLSGALVVYLLKIIFDVQRPVDGVVASFGQSFPSYHAAMATIFFMMLMFIFDDSFSAYSRVIFNAVCTTLILAMAFSRIYLGVHWFSDVFVGIIVGLSVSYISIIIYKDRVRARKAKHVLK